MVKQNQTAEDSSPLITWAPSSAWSNGQPSDPELPNYSAASFKLTTSQGAFASFAFNGTGVWIYGAKRANHGPYTGAIDGVASAQQSGFSAVDDIRALLYSATNLSLGHHVATITNQPVDLVSAPYLDVDYIVWETEISDAATTGTTVLDDASPLLQYTPAGDWTTNGCTNLAQYFFSTCHVTSANTATVKLTFDGDAIAIYGGVGPQYGPYSVTVDSGAPIQYTANMTNPNTKEILYFASNLGVGNHTITLANNPSQVGNIIDVDYFQIMGGGTPSPTTSGSSTGTSSGNSATQTANPKTNVAVIVAPIMVALLLVVAAFFAFFFFRRRRRQREQHDLDLARDDYNYNMGMVPTPYTVTGREISRGSSAAVSDTPLNPNNGGPGPNRPITGYATEYTTSEANPDTPAPSDGAFPPYIHQQHHISSAAVHTSSDAIFVSGSGSGTGSGPPHGGGPLIPTVGEKGGAYTGPTARNDSGSHLGIRHSTTPGAESSAHFEAPPPSYA